MIYIIAYFIILVSIWLLNRNDGFVSVFRSTKKTNWMVASISLFMLYASVDTAQLYSGIISDQGIWGLWLLWVGMISAAIVPLVFAPLWVKLNLDTDNQFTLYRFSGIGAKILHQFRAVYVGGVVVAFSLSFQTIAFSRIIQVYYDISAQDSILITGGLLSLFSLKNSFANKFKTDVFHAILYLGTIVILYYFFDKSTGGFTSVINAITEHSPDTISVLPPEGNQNLWNSLFVYLGIQWWSSSTYDGGGPQMSRFTATGTKWGAIKAGLSPYLLSMPITILVIIMALMSYVFSGFAADGEIGFVKSIFQVVPESFSMVVLIGFFALFITSAESTLNWGASFLTVDFYKGYLVKNKQEKHYTKISFISMLFLSVISMFIALNTDSLMVLTKITFSISAGVAPVFVLRWFWMRMNAWSQLSAMISSGIYTIAFYIFEYFNPKYFDSNSLTAYEWRLIFVTLLTTITWITVTFLTKKDDDKTIKLFLKILPSNKEIVKSFIIAIMMGIGLIAVQTLAMYLVF